MYFLNEIYILTYQLACVFGLYPEIKTILCFCDIKGKKNLYTMIINWNSQEANTPLYNV